MLAVDVGSYSPQKQTSHLCSSNFVSQVIANRHGWHPRMVYVCMVKVESTVLVFILNISNSPLSDSITSGLIFSFTDLELLKQASSFWSWLSWIYLCKNPFDRVCISFFSFSTLSNHDKRKVFITRKAAPLGPELVIFDLTFSWSCWIKCSFVFIYLHGRVPDKTTALVTWERLYHDN